MEILNKTISIDRPLSAVYNEWLRFEDFSQFMCGAKEVETPGSTQQQWDSVLDEQDLSLDEANDELNSYKKISWKSQAYAANGEIMFQELERDKTQVLFHLEYDPKGIIYDIGEAMLKVSNKVEGDLTKFKNHMEHPERLNSVN